MSRNASRRYGVPGSFIVLALVSASARAEFPQGIPDTIDLRVGGLFADLDTQVSLRRLDTDAEWDQGPRLFLLLSF